MVANAVNLFQEALLGDNALGIGVAEPVHQCFIAEVGEQGAANNLFLQCPEKAKELFRAFGEESEEYLAGGQTKIGEDVGKLVGLLVEIGERVIQCLATCREPTKSNFVTQAILALLPGTDMADVVLVINNHDAPKFGR